MGLMMAKSPKTGINLGSGYKLTKSGKVERDEAARIAKLPVNKQIAARKSGRVRVSRNPRLPDGESRGE
jgi:hypothetical protein